MNKEFVCTPDNTTAVQKLIRTWVSTGYTIEIIVQYTVFTHKSEVLVTTSLRRIK